MLDYGDICHVKRQRLDSNNKLAQICVSIEIEARPEHAMQLAMYADRLETPWTTLVCRPFFAHQQLNWDKLSWLVGGQCGARVPASALNKWMLTREGSDGGELVRLSLTV